jgi:hypothetical protein
VHPAAVDDRSDRPDHDVLEHVDVEHDGDDDHYVRRSRRSSGSRADRPAADGVDEHLVDLDVDDQYEYVDDEHDHLHHCAATDDGVDDTAAPAVVA